MGGPRESIATRARWNSPRGSSGFAHPFFAFRGGQEAFNLSGRSKFRRPADKTVPPHPCSSDLPAERLRSAGKSEHCAGQIREIAGRSADCPKRGDPVRSRRCIASRDGGACRDKLHRLDPPAARGGKPERLLDARPVAGTKARRGEKQQVFGWEGAPCHERRRPRQRYALALVLDRQRHLSGFAAPGVGDPSRCCDKGQRGPPDQADQGASPGRTRDGERASRRTANAAMQSIVPLRSGKDSSDCAAIAVRMPSAARAGHAPGRRTAFQP